MSPMVKYSLARVGLFAVVAAVMLAVPIDIHPLLKLAVAVLVSAILALFVLRGLRDRAAEQLVGVAGRRAAKRERLRAALDGSDTTGVRTDDTTGVRTDGATGDRRGDGPDGRPGR